MKAVNVAAERPKVSRHERKDLFTLSIRKIIDDVLLQEIKSGREIRTIAITSPFHSDGKSEISKQLAGEFAAQGNRTLLLDLKSMTEDKAYMTDSSRTLKLLDESIFKTSTKNFDYLSLDDIRKSQAVTLDRISLGSLFLQLRSRYKRIVIDTAPLSEDMSGFIAASTADGVYFICSKSNLHGRQPETHYQKLKEIGAGILGVIYNNADVKLVKKNLGRNGKKHGKN